MEPGYGEKPSGPATSPRGSTVDLSNASIWLYSTLIVCARPSWCFSFMRPPMLSPAVRETQTEFTCNLSSSETPSVAGSTLKASAFCVLEEVNPSLPRLPEHKGERAVRPGVV